MTGRFARFGRTYHLAIAGADDLPAVLELDDGLWVATGAPIDTIRSDSVFLQHLDLDANGRIMCFEVRAAVRWTRDHLRSLDGFDEGSARLRIADIAYETGEGSRIAAAAQKIADHFADSEEITLDQIRTVKAEGRARPVSEHGVVLPEAADDPSVRELIEAVIESVGGVAHPGGHSGVDQRTLEAFVADARRHLNWLSEGEGLGPLGDATPFAFEILVTLEAKIEQFFALSSALELAPGLVARLKPDGHGAAELDRDDADSIREVLAKAPIAPPAPRADLPLSASLNPYYRGRVDEFTRVVAAPILGGPLEVLTPAQWQQLQSAFAEYRRWRERQPPTGVAGLSETQLRRLLEQTDEVRRLIAHAEETAVLLEDVCLVEKLALYQANLLRFLNNFVSVPHLYDPNSRAIFEMGRLTIDGRHFELAVKVVNRAAHKAVAATSSMFVLYVRIRAKSGVAEYEVAVPVTDGGVRNLAIGKRGLFRDVDGVEHDAEIVEIIENPISVSETIVAPFKRIGNLFTKKIESLTAEAQARLDTATNEAASVLPSATPDARGAGAVSSAVASGGGIIAGSGVAVAAIGTALTYFASTISSLSPWRVLVGLGGAVAAVIVPMTVLALLKLRRRDLSAILEGSGWAINLRMRLSRGQARCFTQTPRLPLRVRRRAVRRVVFTIAGLLTLAAVGYLAVTLLR